MLAMLRDFIYLDLPRLASFASQLNDGLPLSSTKAQTERGDRGAQLQVGIGGLASFTAGTKGVLEATSSVTSTLHHRLVATVIDELREAGYLCENEKLAQASDGSFALLVGRLQFIDPSALSSMLSMLPAIQRFQDAFTPTPVDAGASRADRRHSRRRSLPGTQPHNSAQVQSIREVIETFAANSVRVRVLVDGRSIASGVVERDKFVEDLSRLTLRHGLLTSDE